jgi:hypothetical protein
MTEAELASETLLFFNQNEAMENVQDTRRFVLVSQKKKHLRSCIMITKPLSSCRYQDVTPEVSLNTQGFIFRKAVYSRSRDSVVDIATGYGLNDRGVGVRVPVGERIFLAMP